MKIQYNDTTGSNWFIAIIIRKNQYFIIIMTILVIIIMIMLNNKLQAQDEVKRNLHCECVMAFIGCESKTFRALVEHRAGEKLTYEWNQEFSKRKPTQEQLNLECWKKRNDNHYGDGLCCSNKNDNDERDAQILYEGTLEDW